MRSIPVVGTQRSPVVPQCSFAHNSVPMALLSSAQIGRAALLLFVAVANVAAQPPDADFLAAKAAFDRGDARGLDLLAPKLAGYVLEPYVSYWRLKLSLDSADPEAVRTFLEQQRDTPLADRLRVDWLKLLGKRGDWNRFALDYSPSSGEDVELSCYSVQFRLQRDGEAAVAAAKPYWFNGQATPDACAPLFARLFASGDLGVADRRARFRLATEAGNVSLAQALAADMPPSERISPKDLAAAEADPLRALDRGDFRSNRQASRDLALYAVERAARKDAGAARAAWVRVRANLPEPDRLYGNARIAYHGARQLNPNANAWHRELGDAPLSDEQHVWRVRAALRAQAWGDVRAATEAMPAALAQEPGWRYWRARALAAEGRSAEALSLYLTLVTEYHFYALLAAEALGRRIEPRSEPLVPRPGALAAFSSRPGVMRTVKLANLDLRKEMLREWSYVTRGADDEELLVAAEYARRAGLYDRAINAAERTSQLHDFGLRYLAPFNAEFEAAAREQNADLAMLFAIARQESRFTPAIVSSAGASGLMQLMPATARWVAKQLNRADYTSARIADVDLNTQFGAYYFKYWLDRLDGRPVLATAAYNAGPSRAQNWRPAVTTEGAIWVETIPFNETRDYVKKVLANAMFYSDALDQPYVALTDRLGKVTPRSTGVADAAIAAGAP